MHIFCDESGGTAVREPHFTLAAAAMEQDAATRALKKFRKLARLNGQEVKGSSLDAEQRKLFMEVLLNEGCGRGAVVVCVQGERVADWALASWRQRESVLYRHLVAEAVELLGVGAAIKGLTVDGGRYKRPESERVAGELATDLVRIVGRPVPFAYADSTRTAGVQIADVLANTAGKMMTCGPQQEVAEKAFAPLLQCGLLVVRQAQLPRLAPGWLRAA